MRPPGPGPGPKTRAALPSMPSNKSDNRTVDARSVVFGRKVAASPYAKQTQSAIKASGSRFIASPQVGQGGQHVVAGGDHLAVHLVRALRGDQVGDLGDDV